VGKSQSASRGWLRLRLRMRGFAPCRPVRFFFLSLVGGSGCDSRCWCLVAGLVQLRGCVTQLIQAYYFKAKRAVHSR
jgi:hypothetical protein